MRRIEERAIAAGATADGMMEEVGRQIAEAILQSSPGRRIAIVYFGKGHNGGDALVAARHLVEAGWHVELRAQEPDPSKLSKLTGEKLDRLYSARPRGRCRSSSASTF